MRLIRPISSMLCLLAPVAAQGSIHRFYPDIRNANSLAAGDVDGDARSDLVVGLVAEQLGTDPGGVVVHSGLDRSVLFTLVGQGPYDDFGRSVATGDLDGDGRADIVVSSKYGAVGNPNPTLVEAYSGLDGSMLWAMPWPTGESASARVDRVWTGDFDGDARDDAAISIDSGGAFPTHLYLVSGIDGSVLALLSAPSTPVLDGCVGVGRFDGDAIDDLLVADRYAMQPVRALSGADHSVLRSFAWPRPADSAPVDPPSVAGDVDGDGIDDVVFGWTDGPPTHTGTAVVYSGADGSTLHAWTGPEPYARFGSAVAAAGDVDGDGHDDILVSASHAQIASPGTAQVFSGSSGAELMSFADYWQTSTSGFLNAVAAGDVDGDGNDDVVLAQLDLGSPTTSVVELAIRGLGVPERFTRHGEPYEMRAPVGIGIRAPTEDVLGHSMIVSLRGAQAYSTIAALWVGTATSVPLDLFGMVGATILVQPFLSVVTTPVPGWGTSTSSADVALSWPDAASLVGVPIELQWVHEDRWVPNPLGVALTEALTVHLH